MSAPWVWPPVTPSAGSGSSGTIVLTDNTDRFLNADTGSDTNNGKTPATAWQSFTPFDAFLKTIAVIRNAYARLTIAPSTATATLSALFIPVLEGTGQVVIRGTETIAMLDPDDAPVIITADASSSVNAIVANPWPAPAHNAAGWQMICTSGANVGSRRTCVDFQLEGSVAGLIPARLLDFAGVGDTWAIVRPAAAFVWDFFTLNGQGQLLQELTAEAPGVYFSNLEIQNTPAVSNGVFYFSGIDYRVDAGHPGFGFIFGEDSTTLLGSGQAQALDPTATLWLGYGVGCRKEERNASCNEFLSVFGSNAQLFAAACGTQLRLNANAGVCQFAGQLWGQTTGNSPSVICEGDGGQISIARFSDIAVPLSAPTAAPGVVFASGPRSTIQLGNVFMIADPTLLRATAGGLIQILAATNPPFGTSNLGDAQDATGGGRIEWDRQPALSSVNGAELRVTGLTARNTLLATEGTGLVDGLGQSSITRPPTTTPVDGQLVRYPATEMPPRNTGSFFLETSDGLNHALINAPPAGYFTWFGPQSGVVNAGVAAGTPQIRINGLQVDTLSSLAAGDEAQPFNMPSPFVTTFAVIAQRVAGTSAKLQYRGSYSYIPQGNIVTFLMALTAAFQTIPAIIPPAGFGSRLLAAGALLNIFEWNMINNDSVPHTIVLQVTRGAVVSTFTTSFGSASPQQNLSANPNMTLLNGDVVEVKTGEAIVTAGSVVFWGLNEFLPLP